MIKKNIHANNTADRLGQIFFVKFINMGKVPVVRNEVL